MIIYHISVEGFCIQVVAHYVAMTPDGRVFDSSLDKGRPYDLRIGADQVSSSIYRYAGLSCKH